MGYYFFFKGGLKFNRDIEPGFRQFFNYYAEKLSWNDPNNVAKVPCPWYINEDNELTLNESNQSDHLVWMEDLMKRFFGPLGLRATGVIRVIPQEKLDYRAVRDGKPIPDEAWGKAMKWEVDTAKGIDHDIDIYFSDDYSDAFNNCGTYDPY
ncbi:MAG: hypothetical protein KBS66_07945 [Eubacterium sp.]|nr:hypothetical protein [Candidatus Colimonas fimequi]